MDKGQYTHMQGITDEEQDAIVKRAQNATVCIIADTNQKMIGSGVLVMLGERLFVATAKHVIPNNHEIQVVPRQLDSTIPIVGIKRDDQHDLGLLEIDPKRDVTLKDRSFPLDNECNHIDNNQILPVLIIGYPDKLILPLVEEQFSSDVTLQVQAPCCMTIFGETIPRANWPTKGLDDPINESRDVFVQYDPNQKIDRVTSLRNNLPIPPIPNSAPDIPGISGGGIWIISATEGQIWHPTPTLIAIQVSRFKKGKWIRGIIISKWLNLAAKCDSTLSITPKND